VRPSVAIRWPFSTDLSELWSVEDVRRRAKRRLPRIVFDFVEGGAEDEVTVADNRAAFGEVGLEPLYLRDVRERDISATIMGTPVRSPIMLGPTGIQRLAHPEGELAVCRAAGAMGTIYAISTGSGYSIEEIAAVATGPLWFQLYLWRDRDVVAGLVERARAVGCKALCLTIDVPVLGQRERDLRNGLTVPPRVSPADALDVVLRPRWLYDYLRSDEFTFANMRGVERGERSDLRIIQWVNTELFNPGATWDELRWLRGLWDGPIVVKGITDVGDARRAVEEGATGIVVSNHGGRQLDGAPATLERLPRIVEAVGDRAEILMDGGVRRGSDVVKAVSLGATGCLVARPYWYGLGAGGQLGVQRVLEILNAEMDRALALIGRTSMRELDRSAVRVPPSWDAIERSEP
jgi:L-lactate dehydrogenase (cytochrome)